MKKIINIVVLQFILILIISVSAFAEGGMSIKIGDKAPDFKLKKFNSDETVSLVDYKGKKNVLIQFWATWCAICKREIPFLVNHYNANKAKGDFEILAILLPAGEGDKEKVEKLIEKYNIPYPILIDADTKVATEKYGLTGLIPVIAVIDKDGILQYDHVGELSSTDDPIPFWLDDLRGVEED